MDMGVQLFRYSVLTSDDVRKIDGNPCEAVDRHDVGMPKVISSSVCSGEVRTAPDAPLFCYVMSDCEGRAS